MERNRKQIKMKKLEKCLTLNFFNNFTVTKIVVKTKQLNPQFPFNVKLTFKNEGNSFVNLKIKSIRINIIAY